MKSQTVFYIHDAYLEGEIFLEMRTRPVLYRRTAQKLCNFCAPYYVAVYKSARNRYSFQLMYQVELCTLKCIYTGLLLYGYNVSRSRI